MELCGKDSQRRNLLHRAVIEQDLGMLIYLSKIQKSLQNEKDMNGLTPLMISIRQKLKIQQKLLVELGTDLSVGNSVNNVIHQSIFQNNL